MERYGSGTNMKEHKGRDERRVKIENYGMGARDAKRKTKKTKSKGLTE